MSNLNFIVSPLESGKLTSKKQQSVTSVNKNGTVMTTLAFHEPATDDGAILLIGSFNQNNLDTFHLPAHLNLEEAIQLRDVISQAIVEAEHFNKIQKQIKEN